jgi:hypothetical protein
MNYYEVLNVSRKASNAEVKSAYRKLARKLHPDKNNGDETKAREFARIAKAYEILGNPKQRADYDRALLDRQFRSNGGEPGDSENPHVRRWRQMVYEKRYNEIIDRMIADERRESVALQKIIFPMVALFVSTFVVAVFRPNFFSNSAVIGKIILVSLFVAGLIHLFGRLREAFERYTYTENIHDTILDENAAETRPFPRIAAVGFIVGGLLLCLGAGWLTGNYFSFVIHSSMPSLYATEIRPEIIFYPPIIVLFVDLMHLVVSKFE